MRFSSPCYNLASPAERRRRFLQSCHVFADRLPARKQGRAGL
jgi:hypothetical protein